MSAWRREWGNPGESYSADGGGGLLPPWTKRLLLAMGGIYLVLSILGETGWQITDWLAVDPARWWTHPPYLPLWQVVTYGFVHDLGGLGHVLFNCLALFFFGSMVERMLGARAYLTLFLGSVIAGGLLHTVLGLAPAFRGPVIGASGGVMGVMVAAAVLAPRTRVLIMGFVPVQLNVMVGILIVIDLLGFSRVGGGIAHHVHLVGAAFGYLFIRKGWYRIDLLRVAQARRQVRERQRHQDDQERLDALLVRIQREGIASLTRAEREFLQRMSKG